MPRDDRPGAFRSSLTSGTLPSALLSFVLVLLPCASPAAELSAHERDGEAQAVQRASEWLDARLRQVRARSGSDKEALARATLRELPERLAREGAEHDLSSALAPPAGSGREGQGAALRALDTAAHRLRAFARAAARRAPSDPPGARQRTERILQDPLFNLSPRGAGPLQRFLNAAREVLFVIISRVARAAARHPRLLRTLAFVLIAAALAVFLTKTLPLLRRGAGRTRARRAPQSVPAPVDSARRGGDPGALIALARERARAGRLVEALRLYELFAVVCLRARGELPENAGLTDLEAVRWIAAHGHANILGGFESLVALHDAIVYGGGLAPANALAEAERLSAQLAQLGAERAP